MNLLANEEFTDVELTTVTVSMDAPLPDVDLLGEELTDKELFDEKHYDAWLADNKRHAGLPVEERASHD